MWLGELITDRGIGNGMSLLIFTSIAAGFPTSLWQIKVPARLGPLLGRRARSAWSSSPLVVFVEQAQRRIPVQYAKRMVGRRMYGGTSTYIPLKVNQAGVIPVIFASSLLYLPSLVAQLGGQVEPAGLGDVGRRPTWSAATTRSTCCSSSRLIVFFTYFYVAITFNPTEVADNMKKYGGFIPGIRAGRPTAEYLDYVLSRITLPGALYLGCVALIPLIALGLVRRQPELPVRRHRDPDHRRRRAGDGEADREPAAAAQLRGLPPLVRLVLVGPPGRRQGDPGAVHRLALRRSRRSRPATSSGPTSARAPTSASRPRSTWTPATWSPTR